MAQCNNPEARAAAFKAEFPDNTPVWYYPISGDEATKRATWVRGEPWALGHGEVVVKVKDATGCVSIEHIAPRELEQAAEPDAAPEAVRFTYFLQKLYAQLVSRGADADTLNLVALYRDEAATVQEAGLFSDGYHTFQELYAHRVRLFSCLMHAHRNRAWWSDHHDDGTVWDGWVIAGITTPAGEVTYHLPVTEVPRLPEDTHRLKGKPWDGHTAADVLERLPSLNFGRTDGTAYVEPAEEVELVIYAYAASVAGPRGTSHWDGSIERPMIASHADYIEARKEIARDGNVANHDAIQLHHLTPVGSKLSGEKVPAYDAQLVRELQRLGEEFGCPGGMNRIAWLRQQLTAANESKLAPEANTGTAGVYDVFEAIPPQLRKLYNLTPNAVDAVLLAFQVAQARPAKDGE